MKFQFNLREYFKIQKISLAINMRKIPIEAEINIQDNKLLQYTKHQINMFLRKINYD